MKRFILFALMGLLAMSLACSKREDAVVAEIGAKKITVADVERISETLENKFLPAKDDLEGKKQILDHMLNKEIMALKAAAAGYEKEEWFINFWEKFKNPFVVAAMMDEKIRKAVAVTEEEIDKYYEEMHYEYTLSRRIDDFSRLMEMMSTLSGLISNLQKIGASFNSQAVFHS